MSTAEARRSEGAGRLLLQVALGLLTSLLQLLRLALALALRAMGYLLLGGHYLALAAQRRFRVRGAALALVAVGLLGLGAAIAATSTRLQSPVGVAPAQAPSPRVAPDSPTRASPAPESGPTLAQLRVQLGAERLRDRQAAAAAIVARPPATGEELQRELLRTTAHAPADYKNLLRFAGAQVPDQHGRFPKKAAGSRVDWLTALLALDPRHGVADYMRGVLRDTTFSVALMRALARSRTTAAASTLLLFAYHHQGAFRDECGRLLRQIGDPAIPALLRAPVVDHPLAYRMARYANYQLERIDRARPELALRQGDPRLQADILRAYGETRYPSAVIEVIRHTDADHSAVRQAARWATLRYLTGTDAGVARRRLKLPGGRETQEEQQLYLSASELARLELARRLRAAVASDAVPEEHARAPSRLDNTSSSVLARQLFAHYDARRARALSTGIARANRLAQSGHPRAATDELDRLLNALPVNAHPKAASTYIRIAEALMTEGRFDATVRVLTKALRLLPSGTPEASLARGLRLVAEARRDGLGAAGSAWRLKRAARLAPRHPSIGAVAAAAKQRAHLANGGVALSGLVALALLAFPPWLRSRSKRGRRAS